MEGKKKGSGFQRVDAVFDSIKKKKTTIREESPDLVESDKKKTDGGSMIFPYDEKYAEFVEKKRKESDIFYRLFDYSEIDIKRHYITEIVNNILKPLYSGDRTDGIKPKYVLSESHWNIINEILKSNDANILDMFWFFCISKFPTIVDWLVKGDSSNNYKSYVHNPGMFLTFIKRDLYPTCKLFMDSNIQGTLPATVRNLRVAYSESCGFPCLPEEWRMEWSEHVRKNNDLHQRSVALYRESN
jgi:hypothetical protein